MSAPKYFRYDSWTKATTGAAVAGALVFVLVQPFPNIPPTLSPTLPGPQAQVYADNAGANLLQQGIQTDGFGHVSFYALPGIYTVAIYLNATLQQVYPDQLIG
jgi:hypothetical protein